MSDDGANSAPPAPTMDPREAWMVARVQEDLKVDEELVLAALASEESKALLESFIAGGEPPNRCGAPLALEDPVSHFTRLSVHFYTKLCRERCILSMVGTERTREVPQAQAS